jgi:hypothetical protein
MTAPLREQLKNNAFTTLNGGINNSTTSITVTDGSVFPSTGNFRVTVSQEIMLCTARSGNTLTVVRGYEGTGAASHSDLDFITTNLTAGSVDRWGTDNDALWGAARPPLGVISDGAGGILTVSDFTWVHQGGATASDQNGTIVMRCPPAGGENARMLVRTAPSPPWTLIAAFECFGIADDGGIPTVGVLARQSSSGKFFGGTFNSQGGFLGNVFSWAAYTLASPTSFNSTILSRANGRSTPFGRYVWMKLEDDGTDLKFYGSYDGLYWHLLATHDRDSYMTSGGPDQFGWYINNFGSSNFDMLLRLAAWSHS